MIQDKAGIGSLIKSLTSNTLKFAISGIAEDLSELMEDHASLDRLIEQGYAHVKPMSQDETRKSFDTASNLYDGQLTFSSDVVDHIHQISMGYPYFAQLIGKRCVEHGNMAGTNSIESDVLSGVLQEIAGGRAFPVLETKYQRAIGDSPSRAVLLTLLAEEDVSVDAVDGGISLKNIRSTVQDLDIEHMDQLVPRLIDRSFGPALVRRQVQRGTYEFLDPVFRAYVRLRK